MITKNLRSLLGVLPLLVLSGCASTGWTSSELEARFQAAVADAEVAKRSEIHQGLRPVVADEPGLVWEQEPGQSRVLVVTWTQWEGYDDKVEEEMDLTRPVWVTLVPDLQSFCRSYRPRPKRSLDLRLEQLLGLPPSNDKTRFAELWADPKALYRPCPDPEVTDQECGLEFPRGGGNLVVLDEYQRWFENQKESSYGEGGYPWTRLGYTYDWGGRGTVVGLSELIVPAGATVKVRDVLSTEDYCTPSTGGKRR